MGTLFATAVASAKPTDKDYKLSDGAALYLLVRPNGTKLWRLNYIYLGKHRTLAFGAWPEVSLADARSRRDEARRLIAAGTDPSRYHALPSAAQDQEHVWQAQGLATHPYPLRSLRPHLHVRHLHRRNRQLLAQSMSPERSEFPQMAVVRGIARCQQGAFQPSRRSSTIEGLHMHNCAIGISVAAAACMLSTPVKANDLWIGVYQHDVTLSSTKFETGQDIKAGWIGDPISFLSAIGRPSPHVLISASLNGNTNYLAAGLNWRFGHELYVRPGIGVAVHDGPAYAVRNGRRVDLGSPVLFEPEIAFGWQLSKAIALEASWIHLSHGTLFSRQNRGMDSWGLRAVMQLR